MFLNSFRCLYLHHYFCFSKMFPFPVYRRLDFDLRYSVFKVRFSFYAVSNSQGTRKHSLLRHGLSPFHFIPVLSSLCKHRRQPILKCLGSLLSWRLRDSNSRPPACKAGALPTELSPHLIRQPPAFPYRLQYSIIGRLGLNHRVRDENGCVP